MERCMALVLRGTTWITANKAKRPNACIQNSRMFREASPARENAISGVRGKFEGTEKLKGA
jgi:hypothetical protein